MRPRPAMATVMCVIGASAIAVLPSAVLPSAANAADGPRPVLRLGDEDPAVQTLQRRLTRLRFAPGPVKGRYDRRLRTAVWAFQKANRLRPRRSGRVNRRTWAALDNPRRLRRIGPGGGNRVEIRLTRQLLSVYRGGRLRLVAHISTGSGRRYCARGRCGVAITPRGDFRIHRRFNGWEHGPLGSLYRPMYFHGGIAVHGSIRVPLRRASHGCVRVPLHQADRVYRLVRHNMRVRIR